MVVYCLQYVVKMWNLPSYVMTIDIVMISSIIFNTCKISPCLNPSMESNLWKHAISQQFLLDSNDCFYFYGVTAVRFCELLFLRRQSGIIHLGPGNHARVDNTLTWILAAQVHGSALFIDSHLEALCCFSWSLEGCFLHHPRCKSGRETSQESLCSPFLLHSTVLSKPTSGTPSQVSGTWQASFQILLCKWSSQSTVSSISYLVPHDSVRSQRC